MNISDVDKKSWFLSFFLGYLETHVRSVAHHCWKFQWSSLHNLVWQQILFFSFFLTIYFVNAMLSFTQINITILKSAVIPFLVSKLEKYIRYFRFLNVLFLHWFWVLDTCCQRISRVTVSVIFCQAHLFWILWSYPCLRSLLKAIPTGSNNIKIWMF